MVSLREQLVEDTKWRPVRSPATAPGVAAGAGAAISRLQPRLRALPRGQQAVKRAIDLAVAGVLLVVVAPLLFVLCIAIRIDSAGPALFRQWRLGLNGKPFRILKLRTLTVTEDGYEFRQVTKDDPRITRLGRILRRFSLDELPQLVNVVRGEMSLVGPRPHALAHDRESAALIPEYALRRKVKPGMTGWAQIHGCRGETASAEEMRRRVGFDLWYVAHAGLVLDLRILLATPRVVLLAQNAG